MGVEMLSNTTFNSGTSGWYIAPVYAENSTTWVSSGGISGTGCVKMTITRTSDPGMCVIHQNVTIKTGMQYRLSFYARRSGNIDVWARTTIDGKTTNYASAIPSLSSSSDIYKKIEYIINVPSQSKSQVSANIALIAGSATGTVWFDNASFEQAGSEQNPSTATYKNCYVESKAYKYSMASTSSDHVYSHAKGSRVNVSEISDNTFIRDSDGWYLKRSCINTAKSDKTSGRNSSNMFGSSTLQYASPAPEQAKVYNLQWTLNRLGYNCGTVDGKFGQGTESAVRSFQKAKSLSVDGKVGTKTKAALISALDALDS